MSNALPDATSASSASPGPAGSGLRFGAARRVGVYPGSFNPPTIAHLAIAEAARDQRRLDEVHLVMSRRALDKESVERPTLDERLHVLRSSVADHPWLSVAVSDAQLIADIARGYDVVIMGGDKWAQVHDLRYYRSVEHRDECVAALPHPALVPRASFAVPAALRLDIPDDMLAVLDDVSSTGARAGRSEWMTDAARTFAEDHGGWPSPAP